MTWENVLTTGDFVRVKGNLYLSPSLLRQKCIIMIFSLTRARPTRCRGQWRSSLSGSPCSSGPATWCSATTSLQIIIIIIIIIMPANNQMRERISCIRWDGDNLFKIPGPTLGEKLGYFQDIYSLTHTVHLCHCLIRQYKPSLWPTLSLTHSLQLTSFGLIPHDPVEVDVGARLAGAQGLRLSQGPSLSSLWSHL